MQEDLSAFPLRLRAAASAGEPLNPEIIETIRALLMGHEPSDWPVAVAWCLLILVASWAWATVLFRRRTRR